MYDLIIIGGGPGGVAAGVYAGRKKIKTLLIAESIGGGSVVSEEIKNWIGEKSIAGMDLAAKLENHLRDQEGVEIKLGERVAGVKKITDGFEVSTAEGGYQAKTLLIASGSGRRKLNVPGEKNFEGKGVVYCATCDAPLFKNKAVVVAGGGNAGLEAAEDLLNYASKIYLLEYGDAPKGDAVTLERIKKSPILEIITNAETKEILGEQFVSGLKYLDRKSGEEKTLAIQGVFVEIGLEPNSSFIKDLASLNDRKEIVIDHKTMATSANGIWAAGDVTDVLYKQNNIAAGDAIKAILSIDGYLRGK